MISGVWLRTAAACSGVRPFPVRALGSAPALTRAVTTSGVWLFAAARCSGVRPATSRALGSAPALTRAVTTSGVWLNCRRPVQRGEAERGARVGVRAGAQTVLNSGGSCSFKKRRCGPIVASDLSDKGRYDTQCEKPGYGEERQM